MCIRCACGGAMAHVMLRRKILILLILRGLRHMPDLVGVTGAARHAK